MTAPPTLVARLFYFYLRRAPPWLRRWLAPFVNSEKSLGMLLAYVWIGVLGQVVLFGALQILLLASIPRVAALTLAYATTVAMQFFLNK